MKLLGPLLRPAELEGRRLPGAFYFLVGTGTVFAFFPLDTARYAVECLALADPFAAFVGQSLLLRSRMITKSASVAGSAACFVMALLVGVAFLQNGGVLRITMGALACTFGEAVSCGLDDNLTIPVVTALAAHLFR